MDLCRLGPYPAVLDTIFIENVFGRNLSTYLFFFTPYDHYSFTDSIGFNILWATTWNNWVPRYLAGCIIDGVKYGNTVTSIADINKYSPSDFKLHQNYPNPFNSSTTISFSIPKKTQVTINIYDVIGRKAKIALNEVLNSGDHSFILDMKNFASGIYYCQMQAGKYSECRKLLLMN